MTDITIGERIRKLRELNHYTREVFAEKIDISSKFLYEIESDRKGFSSDILSRMSKVLCVSCDYIMFGKESEYNKKKKIMCTLEKLQPSEISRMQSIIRILNDMLKEL